MARTARIDVHHHFVPAFWEDGVESRGGDPSGWKSPSWSVDAAMEFMDSVGTAKAILSLTTPSVAIWDGEERREMARRVNDFSAGLVIKWPQRFGHFATLPLPDVEGAVAEARRALDELHADGVILLSSYDGRYLGDPAFEPLWKELNERGAVVFVHPGLPKMDVLPEVPGPLVDFPFDTTRTAVHMAAHGIVERYTRTRIILSHAGGFLPYAAHRFAGALHLLNPNKFTVQGVLEQLKSFYFDTALSSGDVTMGALLEFAGPEHVLFGSDFPYAPSPLGKWFAQQLDENARIPADVHTKINHGNAKKLFSK